MPGLKSQRPYLVVLSVFTALGFFPLAHPTSFRVDATKSPVIENFPAVLGAWQGKDEPIEDKIYEILETRNVLSRTYQNEMGHKINLLLVGSHKDRRVAHPPEVCFLASNYAILNQTEGIEQIDGHPVPVRKFLAQEEKRPENRQEVLYLYKIGDQLTTNYYTQQLQFAVGQLTRKKADVYLIRLAAHDPSHLLEFLAEVLKQL